MCNNSQYWHYTSSSHGGIADLFHVQGLQTRLSLGKNFRVIKLEDANALAFPNDFIQVKYKFNYL